jgi:hypothetical protein
MKYWSLAYLPTVILIYCYGQGILVYFKIGYFPIYGITPQPSLSLCNKIELTNGLAFILLLISLFIGIIISAITLLRKKYSFFKNDVLIFLANLIISIVSLTLHSSFWDWLLD